MKLLYKKGIVFLIFARHCKIRFHKDDNTTGVVQLEPNVLWDWRATGTLGRSGGLSLRLKEGGWAAGFEGGGLRCGSLNLREEGWVLDPGI